MVSAGDVVGLRQWHAVPSVDAGKTEQRLGSVGIRLRPQVVEERAVGGNQPVQLRRQLRHRLNMINACSLRHARRGRIHLHAGVLLHAQIARGEKQNFLVGARRGGLRRVAHDHQRGARLGPAG